ncbi:spore cortex-lytic enzyme [Paenibacillus sediminis]|uniref:Spore cortex-lytic enzyme n=1 Tax=Paenibacillus sediminis TaxID=664909 RepID=A0ABS4H1F0_9BACL|nr:spore cortex-lytic enzyme [Paenibacillus sediminis]MBP1936361.1 N-acetylmuramoyl-L-alanine amidase [Paenibacillus sediminis]
MKKAKIWISTGLVLLIMGSLFGTYQLKQSGAIVPTFSSNIIQYGSSGQDVYELQGRLKYLGFYNGKIDAYFGDSTLKSVKWFQSEFGMKADGIVGGKTKLKLYNATKNWKPTGSAATIKEEEASSDDNGETPSSNPLGLTDNDLKLMANAVNGEARGEPFEGQVAVAAVILNRVKSPNFPNTVSGVIFQPGAFTAVADGQIWLTPNETSRKAVQQAVNGWDPTGGCLYYFNPKTATSKWIWSRPQVKTIGNHIFCM